MAAANMPWYRTTLSHKAPAFALALVVLASCGGDSASPELVIVLRPKQRANEGYLTVTGTVQVDQPIPQGTRVVFGITNGRPTALGVFDESAEAKAPAPTRSVTLRLQDIRAAEAYSFFVGVDLNADGVIGVGDLGGYYHGSTILPYLDPATATLIPIKSSISGLDFGIGPIK